MAEDRRSRFPEIGEIEQEMSRLSHRYRYRRALRSTTAYMRRSIAAVENKFISNTTLAVIVTNARFEKSALCKIAGMGHDGLARSVRPVHTSADGDSVFARSVGDVAADQDLVGELGAEMISEAIIRAVYSAHGAYGLPAAADLERVAP